MIAVVIEALTYLLYLSPLALLVWAVERRVDERKRGGRR